MPPPPAATTSAPASTSSSIVAASRLARLGLGEIAADRLVRRVPCGVVAIDLDARDDGGHDAVDAALRQRVLERGDQQEAERGLRLGHAPVERNGRDDAAGEVVLHEQVANLGPVAVRHHHVVSGRHELDDLARSVVDRALL
jgi:hypothetical protein